MESVRAVSDRDGTTIHTTTKDGKDSAEQRQVEASYALLQRHVSVVRRKGRIRHNTAHFRHSRRRRAALKVAVVQVVLHDACDTRHGAQRVERKMSPDSDHCIPTTAPNHTAYHTL